MTYAILLILDVICEENLTKAAHDAANVNVRLGIVQVKLRFHGGIRGKELVKD